MNKPKFIKLVILPVLFLSFFGISNSFALDNQSCDLHGVESKPENIVWINSIEAGIKQAKQENKYVMINFCANWCEPCNELDKYTYTNKELISALNKDFITIKIDISKISNPSAITSKYAISELPSIIFFNKKFELIPDKKITGFIKATDFMNLLDKVIKI